MTHTPLDTTDEDVTVRPASADDIDTVVEVLTDAFLISPVGDWLIPDLHTRRTVYQRYFRLHVEHAHDDGFIHLTTDEFGAALWFPHVNPVDEPDGYEQRLAAACGEWARRFQLIDTVFAGHHPGNPHYYLAFIGVAPAAQRQGLGNILLAHHHANLDRRGLPAYLEASTETSRDLYLRHGYTILGSGPFHLPENGPPIWPMWRAPQAGTAGRDKAP